MRAGLITCAGLAAAALLGLTPFRVFAADPPSVQAEDLGSVAAGATAGAAEHAATPARQDASTRQDTSARENSPTRGDASARGEHAASDRPDRAMPRHGHGVPAGPPLDLSAPPINHVMTREQVQALISGSTEEGPEDVMVEEDRYQEPVPRGQIRALAWALLHPLEAWRIFTPVTD